MQQVEENEAGATAEVTQPPRKKRAESSPPKSSPHKRGIGDNSRDAADANGDEAAASENVTNATFLVATNAAEQAVAEFRRVMTQGSIAVKPMALAALTALYALIWAIYQAGAIETYRIAQNISGHGNSENPIQPLVAHFFRQILEEYVRQTVSRWSAIISVGLDGNVDPNDFRSWVVECGLENLHRQYKAKKLQAGNSDAVLRAQEALAYSILPDANSVPVVTGNETTKGFEGLNLASVTVEDPGTGDYRLLKVLPLSPAEVKRFLANLAKKKSKSNG